MAVTKTAEEGNLVIGTKLYCTTVNRGNQVTFFQGDLVRR